MTVEIRDTSVETNKEMDKTNKKVASLGNNSPIRSFIIRKIFDSYNYLILFSYIIFRSSRECTIGFLVDYSENTNRRRRRMETRRSDF